MRKEGKLGSLTEESAALARNPSINQSHGQLTTTTEFCLSLSFHLLPPSRRPSRRQVVLFFVLLLLLLLLLLTHLRSTTPPRPHTPSHLRIEISTISLSLPSARCCCYSASRVPSASFFLGLPLCSIIRFDFFSPSPSLTLWLSFCLCLYLVVATVAPSPDGQPTAPFRLSTLMDHRHHHPLGGPPGGHPPRAGHPDDRDRAMSSGPQKRSRMDTRTPPNGEMYSHLQQQQQHIQHGIPRQYKEVSRSPEVERMAGPGPGLYRPTPPPPHPSQQQRHGKHFSFPLPAALFLTLFPYPHPFLLFLSFDVCGVTRRDSFVIVMLGTSRFQ